MARPHHRKKHKEHLRQYQQSRGGFSTTAKTKGTSVFAIVGGVIGLAIAYFATQGNIVWIIAGGVVGAGLGYVFGNSIDKSSRK